MRVNPTTCIVRVLLDVPQAQGFDYLLHVSAAQPLTPQALCGQLCVVPLGSRKVVGIICALLDQSAVANARLKSVEAVLDIAPLPEHWLALTRFAAEYYQQGWGEAALSTVPRSIRVLHGAKREAMLKRLRVASDKRLHSDIAEAPIGPPAGHVMSQSQQAAIDAIQAHRGFACDVLFGVTGSGKTEVYLEAMADRLARSAHAQVLLLVPEINLTPQLEKRVRARFPILSVATLHSGMADGARAAAWLAALEGRARIVLGTRSAIFVPMPHLALICVDEEHDPSFKAGDGLRYSGRDLAVKRAQLEDIAVVLGSATPSVESWAKVQKQHYGLLRLPHKAAHGSGAHAQTIIQTIDLRTHARVGGLSEPVRTALQDTHARGEQSLVFINRRGYAPVLSCESCGWLSSCPQCTAYAAFHRIEMQVRCHHCGWSVPVPRACPGCGNPDLSAVGSGTQRIEEAVQHCLPDGRVARLDRDSTRRKGSAQQALDAVHEGQVDVLVGTQMLTKGHDFRRVTTVVVLNVDAQLVSHDFRATERLFATLTQVVGRAGRAGLASRAWIETRYPQHPIFSALAQSDYAAFAQTVLAERQTAHLPPFVFQALITAESSTLEAAMGALKALKQALAHPVEANAGVMVYDPVPMVLVKRANVYRAQLLMESAHRSRLHRLLAQVDLGITKGQRPAVRLRVEVDPQEI